MDDRVTPPGWYFNPASNAQQYWDGSTWLDIPAPQSNSSNTSEVQNNQNPTYSLAVIALVFSFLFPLLGWILGVRAFNDIRKSDGKLGGAGLAKAAIWLGVIGTVGILIIIGCWMYLSNQLTNIDTGESGFTCVGPAEWYFKGSLCNP